MEGVLSVSSGVEFPSKKPMENQSRKFNEKSTEKLTNFY